MIRTETSVPTDASTGLVLMDIGNSRVALATWSGGVRSPSQHLAGMGPPAVAHKVCELWETLASCPRRTLVVSSVCPPVAEAVLAACHEQGIAPLLMVGRDIDLPITADVPAPLKVGTDRLCVAAAAYARVRGACVVADFGTALTIDLVADNNVFLGGTILPGLRLSAQALHEHTALLPLVEIGTPTETLGKDTASAIRNGIYAMMVGALREIAERYATQIGKWPPLVLTGGDATAIASACDFVDLVVPDLCLDGLVIAYRKAAGLCDDDDAPE